MIANASIPVLKIAEAYGAFGAFCVALLLLQARLLRK